MIARQFVEKNDVEDGKNMSIKMASMLFGLIRANSDVRIFKSSAQHGNGRNRNKSRIKNRKFLSC